MQTAIDKSKNGYTEEENKGKTGNRTYPEAVLESHYVHEKSKRQLLTSNLNIHSMYERYQSEVTATGFEPTTT